MEFDLLTKIFSEGGMIYLLFFMIVGGFIWKGIPYLADRFEKIVENFLNTIKEMQINYKEELKEIRETFVVQIEKSNLWHETHDKKITELKDLINSKKGK